MTDSYEIQNSAVEWLKIIETKNFVDDGMSLRMKITLHHLTVQEYFHFKNKWWLHSNKQGSNTIPLTHRPDFKQALSTLHRLQREAEEDPQVPTYSKHKSTMGTEFFFYMVELTRYMVDSLSFRKSRRRCTNTWMNGVTCWLQYLERFFWIRLSWI